jgi:hypothetical protein
MITLESRFIRNDSLLATEIDGDVVMMDVGSGRYFHLDNTGSKIWTMMDGPTTVSDICDRLLKAYDGDAGKIQADVLAFFARMEASDLVRTA